MRSLILIFLITAFASSCASYVQSVHSQISREQNAQKMKRQKRYYDPYGAYRGVPMGANDARPIKNPKTLGNNPTTATSRNMAPQTNRSYGKKRTKVDDLKDNGSSGSLWSGKNSETFLFVTNNIKRQGDIVIIEVLKPFKSKITSELKNAFPERRLKKKKTTAKAEAPAPTPEAAPGPEKETGDNKVYDKISTTVVEEVNKDYVLIRGRKEILYKKAKRFIEVQALVSRKDISDNDAVKSSRILEPKIMVLRY